MVATETAMSEERTGVVRRFDDVAGWGFIRADGAGRDTFVHVRALLQSVPPLETLFPGQRVAFRVRDGGRGPQAVAVRLLDRR
jgi:CspA family cold shock protein